MIDAKKLRELEANLKKKANGGSYFIHLQIDYQETLDLIALAKKGLESEKHPMYSLDKEGKVITNISALASWAVKAMSSVQSAVDLIELVQEDLELFKVSGKSQSVCAEGTKKQLIELLSSYPQGER